MHGRLHTTPNHVSTTHPKSSASICVCPRCPCSTQHGPGPVTGKAHLEMQRCGSSGSVASPEPKGCHAPKIIGPVAKALTEPSAEALSTALPAICKHVL